MNLINRLLKTIDHATKPDQVERLIKDTASACDNDVYKFETIMYDALCSCGSISGKNAYILHLFILGVVREIVLMEAGNGTKEN